MQRQRYFDLLVLTAAYLQKSVTHLHLKFLHVLQRNFEVT